MEQFVTRQYTDSGMMAYYEDAKNMWRAWGQVAWMRELLSDTGVAVLDGERPVCLAWVYLPRSSRMAYMGPLVSDRVLRQSYRTKAVTEAVEAVVRLCKASGYDTIGGCTSSPALQKYILSNQRFRAVSANSMEFLGVTWQ